MEVRGRGRRGRGGGQLKLGMIVGCVGLRVVILGNGRH